MLGNGGGALVLYGTQRRQIRWEMLRAGPREKCGEGLERAEEEIPLHPRLKSGKMEKKSMNVKTRGMPQ